jgi:hypothetical protein
VLAAAITMFCVGVVVTMSPTRRTSPRATPAKAPSRSEIKIEQLFRANASLVSDPALAGEYQSINARHFGGVLPAVRIRWEARLEEIGPLIAEGFRLQGVTNGQVILLNPAIEDDEPQRRRALCHEVAHVALADRRDGHGPAFQTLLRRLSAEAAFEGVVATDQEKADLRASLERRTEELDRESSHLRAVWSELDTADAVRVEEYNSRVRRLQDAAADFNRLVVQYNLMLSYPDGLDEDRLARRALPLSAK